MNQPRVLVVHNRYQLPGGEDAVVEAEIELLRRNGHPVETYLRDNHDLTAMKAVEAFAHTLWSRRTWNDIARLAAKFRPDVIHAHNTFVLVSSSLYWAADRLGIPVVQTLHNFRLLCVQAMFLHDGRVCEDCLGRAIAWPSVVRENTRTQSRKRASLATAPAQHATSHPQTASLARMVSCCRETSV